MTETIDETVVVEVLLFGQDSVGKSSLLIRSTEGRFIGNVSATMGFGLEIKKIQVQEKQVELRIWDIPDYERYQDSLAERLIQMAAAAVVCFTCKALNYQQTKPEFTFYYPHTRPSLESTETDETPKPKQHTATLTPNRKYWRCDLDPDAYFGPLEQQQAIWFGIPRGEESSMSHRGIGQTIRIPNLATLSAPSSRNLTLIEWRNERGENKRFRLKQLICHLWKELGCLLEIPLPVIHCWERKYREDPMDSINAVLSHWLENPTDYYPISWEGLDRLLNHAELGEVAEELKHALESAS